MQTNADMASSNLDSVNKLKEELSRLLQTTRLSETQLYIVFQGMRGRCYCKTSGAYHKYGAKGVKICDEWMNSFDGKWKFMKWALENGYRKGLTIDRIDPEKDYSPDNCRWVDLYEQANNKRNTVKYNCYGKTLTVGEIARMYNVDIYKMYRRVKKGMTAEEAIADIRK